MHPDSNTPTTTEPRTMTVSELGEYLCQRRPWSEYAKAEDLVGVTIVPDPEPVPQFEDVAEAETYIVPLLVRTPEEQQIYRDLRFLDLEKSVKKLRAEFESLRAVIADAKGMGR